MEQKSRKKEQSRAYFRKKAATVFKTRSSLKENAKDLLMCLRQEYAAGGLGGLSVSISIQFRSPPIRLNLI